LNHAFPVQRQVEVLVLITRVLLSVIVVAASSVTADAQAPLGARCSKSSDCATKRCSSNVCKNHLGTTKPLANGARCQTSAECSSRTCKSNTCGGPKAAPASSSKPAPASRATPAGGTAPAPAKLDGYADDYDPVAPHPVKRMKDSEKTACGQRVIDKKLHDTRKTAEELCAKYTPAEFAKAEKLLAAGYFTSFLDLLALVRKYTDAELTCAKKAWDDSKPEYVNRSRRFNVKDACKQPEKPE